VFEADPAGAELDFRLALINPGNRAALVTGLDPALVSMNGSRVSVLTAFDVEPDRRPPLLVQPGEIVTLYFSGTLDLPALFERGAPPAKGSTQEFDGLPTRHIIFGVAVSSMNSSGVQYEALSGLLSMHITNESVAEWHHDEVKSNLFRDWYR
jgi:hypothetical protein